MNIIVDKSNRWDKIIEQLLDPTVDGIDVDCGQGSWREESAENGHKMMIRKGFKIQVLISKDKARVRFLKMEKTCNESLIHLLKSDVLS